MIALVLVFCLGVNSFAVVSSSSKIAKTPSTSVVAQAQKQALVPKAAIPLEIGPTLLANGLAPGSPESGVEPAPPALPVLSDSILLESSPISIGEPATLSQNGLQVPSLIEGTKKFAKDIAAAGSQPEIPLAENFDGAFPSPKLPPGIKSVSVDVVRADGDIDRLIPYGVNSKELVAKLKHTLGAMAPYSIYTYHDFLGGSINAIDLSSKPDLVNALSEQHSHEVKLIKKLQVLTQDLQVLVREKGKTPDIIMGGMVTELKSVLGQDIVLNILCRTRLCDISA